MTDQETTPQIAIACNMTALDADQREQHGITTRQLLSSMQDVQELPTGYAFKLPAAQLFEAAEFIGHERLCCPFFTFSLVIEPNNGPVWLHLSGSQEIKAFIRTEFGSQLDTSLASKLAL